MLLFALAILAASEPQTAVSRPVEPIILSAPEVYRRPAVAPYEPPSNFGRQVAEGDADARPRRANGRADADGDYQAAVEDRRRQAQALMGPLDGLWRLTDDRGQPLMDLALTDPGPGEIVQGAWTLTTPQGAVRSGVVRSVVRDGAGLRIDVGDGVRITVLDIAGRRVGSLSDDSGERPVVFIPAG